MFSRKTIIRYERGKARVTYFDISTRFICFITRRREIDKNSKRDFHNYADSVTRAFVDRTPTPDSVLIAGFFSPSHVQSIISRDYATLKVTLDGEFFVLRNRVARFEILKDAGALNIRS